jgi:hypothetical protein
MAVTLAEGSGTIVWDGRNQGGESAAPGVYWIRIEGAGSRTGARVVKTR